MSADEALNRVTAHADDGEWRTLMNALRMAARNHEEFSTGTV